jgi:gliding motility-associated-like protein
MKFAATLSIILIGVSGFSQLSSTTSTELNTNCNGTDCNYSGPTILINELMISPSVNDGSISGSGGNGEWIELYNPNLCETIDISCYYLGNDTPEGNGGFVIPPGTIVPPSGYCLIRGVNVPAVPSNLLVQNGGNVVEIVVPAALSDPGVCAAGTRLWFPNAGGWFAFYDPSGNPQDAVSWISAANTGGTPCIPALSGCGTAALLPSYNDIPTDRKNYLNTAASLILGSSVRRFPDGGAWDTQAAPTYATCNGTCIPAGTSSCTGTATVNVSGGTPPYTYSWDDSQVQTTQTAVDLCAGTYNVTVTDNLGETAVFQVTIEDFIPTVSVDLPAELCVDANAVAVTMSPNAGAGQTGILSGNGISGSNFNPGSAGVGNHTINYYFEDEFGCSNAATDAIVVNPLPIVSISNNESPYCLSLTPADLILTPAGGQLTGTGVTNNQFIPAQAGIGTFTLTYTYQDANGCSNSTTINVQVTAPAPPTLTIPSDLCVDAATVTMIGSPAGGVFQIDGSPSTNQFNPLNEGSGSHTIDYVVTDGNGCIASATENLTVHNLPAIQLSVNDFYCYQTGFYALTPSPAGGTLTGDLVQGNGINVDDAFSGPHSVTYSYTDQFGCSNSVDANYEITKPFFPGYTYETDCFQGAYLRSFIFSQSQNVSYQWTVDGVDQEAGPGVSVTFPSPGNHSVQLTITDSHGCSYDSTGVIQIAEGAKIETLAVPNVITPNGDGVNDFLQMPSLLTDCFTYKIFIVNRWGNLVYELENPTDLFDGHNLNGAELDEGVYFYSIESEDFDCDEEKFKGFCYGNISISR